MRNNNNSTRKTDSTATIVKESYSQNLIGTINNAVKRSNLITIHYYSNEKGLTERIIEPMDVVIRMGKKNLVGWCQLRNDWRTFRIDRINFVKVHMNDIYEVRADYDIKNFQDEGSNYSSVNSANSDRGEGRTDKNDRGEKGERTERVDKYARPANKDFGFSTENIKTMSENKLNFSNEDVKVYSEDVDDMAL
jgi:predicted DNA-binding transcriptional regulator YafY